MPPPIGSLYEDESDARPTAREPRPRRSLWRRLRQLLSDCLREHPVFELDETPCPIAPSSAARLGVVEAAELSESQRESLYLQQWLRIFQVRLRLTALIGIASVLCFVGFYFLLFPTIDRLILLVTAFNLVALIGQIPLSFRVQSLGQIRSLAVLGFLLFSLSSAAELSLVVSGANSSQLEGARAVQFIIAVSFAHNLVASLVLPLRLRDTLGVSLIALGALVVGLSAIPVAMRAIPIVGALWTIGTLAFFVTLLAHFNSRLRRRVFDSAFDLALQALKLKAISETDALTGGFNRRHCERVLANELVRSARFSHPLSVLMFDLDSFKPVNDTLGHGVGDLVLTAVHDAAQIELREVDDLSRIGGDEFLIVLPETEEKQAQRIARRLHARVARELQARFGSQSLAGQVTISIGALTLAPGHSLELKAVLDGVDELLYQAKKAGRNRVVRGVAAIESMTKVIHQAGSA